MVRPIQSKVHVKQTVHTRTLCLFINGSAHSFKPNHSNHIFFAEIIVTQTTRFCQLYYDRYESNDHSVLPEV